MPPYVSRSARRTIMAPALCAAAAVIAALAVQIPQAAAETGHAAPHLAVPAGSHRLASGPSDAPAAVIGGPLINHHGPVQTAPRVYVDFWGWTSDPSGEQPYLTAFLSSIGATSWLGTVDQYGAGSPAGLLAGTWSDPAAVPASPSDAQIQAEAANAAAHFGLGSSVNVQIVVATPTGHSGPGFGTTFCADHGVVPGAKQIPYTNLPYVTDAGAHCGEGWVNGAAGTLDGVSIVEGHELAESITDPLLNAWYDAGGNEIGDKCAWTGLADITTTAGSFAVQPLWSNAANGCALPTSTSGPPLLAVLGNDGSVSAKGGGLSAGWVPQTSGVKQIAIATDPVNGPLIAVVDNDGTVSAKEGSLTAGWVTEASGVLGVAVASDPTHGPLIAILGNDGTVSAKQGSLSAPWVTQASAAVQVSVASDSANGPLIAVLGGDGTVSAKQGSLTAAWVAEASGITQIAAAGDPANGPLLAILGTDGTVSAKEGSLSAGWVHQADRVQQIAAASDANNGPLIAIIGNDSTASAKQGSLSAGWVTEAGSVQSFSVATDPDRGPLVGILGSNGSVSAKEGSLSAAWVAETNGAAQVSVAG